MKAYEAWILAWCITGFVVMAAVNMTRSPWCLMAFAFPAMVRAKSDEEADDGGEE